MAAPASEAFLAYQRHLAERIKAIEQRERKPQKGDDILLSVITDGRHAAIDLRFVRSQENEPENKLNALIDKVFAFGSEPRTTGSPAPTAFLTPCPARPR